MLAESYDCLSRKFHTVGLVSDAVVTCEIKLFQCFISHVTTSETEIELFQSLKAF